MDTGRGSRALPDSKGGVSAPVGVVDHGIEGLVDPLPEQHRRRGPETERASRRHHGLRPHRWWDRKLEAQRREGAGRRAWWRA